MLSGELIQAISKMMVIPLSEISNYLPVSRNGLRGCPVLSHFPEVTLSLQKEPESCGRAWFSFFFFPLEAHC